MRGKGVAGALMILGWLEIVAGIIAAVVIGVNAKEDVGVFLTRTEVDVAMVGMAVGIGVVAVVNGLIMLGLSAIIDNQWFDYHMRKAEKG